MKRHHFLVCDSCGCVSCECDPNNPHSPGQKEDSFDNGNYDPWNTAIFGDEPTVEELMGMGSVAA